MSVKPASIDIAATVERRTLDNGLRVVVSRDESHPLVAINLWYHVGSKNELPGRTGLAHLFEHMLFQGSQHVAANDHFRYVQQVGGIANASTSFDRTNYYETMPSRCLELGLWLESDRMGYFLPALDSEKLETQREVVMNERRERVDNQPYGRAFERLHELLYPGDHPYHWPILGYMEDIEAATLDDVRTFFERFYSPANAVLTMVGDLDTARAFDLAAKYFGDLPAAPKGSHLAPARPQATEEGGPRREEMTDRVALTRLYTAFRIPGLLQPDSYAADMLASALAGGKSSPLYDDLVHRRQLAQEAGAFVIPMESGSTFVVIATVRPGVDPQTVETAINEHLTTTRDALVDEVDFERTRNQTLTSFFSGVEAANHRADILSSLTTYFDDPYRIDTEVSRYLAVNCEQIRALARSHLDPDRQVTLRVVPAEPGE